MTSGQIFLTLGAIALLLYTTVNINRTYVSSVQEEVRIKKEIEIINYGQSLSELMFSQSTNYENLVSEYGHLDDVTDSDSRLSYQTQTDEMFYATIEISSEKPLMLGETGRIATITIYAERDEEYIQKGKFFAAITPM